MYQEYVFYSIAHFLFRVWSCVYLLVLGFQLYRNLKSLHSHLVFGSDCICLNIHSSRIWRLCIFYMSKICVTTTFVGVSSWLGVFILHPVHKFRHLIFSFRKKNVNSFTDLVNNDCRVLHYLFPLTKRHLMTSPYSEWNLSKMSECSNHVFVGVCRHQICLKMFSFIWLLVCAIASFNFHSLFIKYKRIGMSKWVSSLFNSWWKLNRGKTWSSPIIPWISISIYAANHFV